ncbi:MAG: type II secretion system protein [Deltaproteobacteria bacterium]|nr:type II secretion system protein [Deltaproteobacteria bacterium]
MGKRSGSLSSGFTLVEVMLVMAILATLTTLMWSSFSQASRSKKRVESAQDRTHTVRVALMRMAREIEMAFVSDSNTIAIEQVRTRFVATSHPDVDDLTFASFAHQRLRGGVPESDTSNISYFGERDPDNRDVLNLMRRETRRLQAADPLAIPGETYVLCPNIVRLKLAFYNYRKKEWQEDWNTKVPGMSYLPSHVRISLTVLDERGKEVSYATDARIHMTETVGYR